MTSTTDAAQPQPVPAAAGIGLRHAHHAEFLESRPRVGWVEIHSENFFADGGPDLDVLDRVRENYPVSCHGVGLSLGSTDPLDREHLRKLARLIDRCEPFLVSEHCSFSSVDGRFVNDLLPLPYTEEALAHLVARVAEAQDLLGRPILIENPSTYLEFTCSGMWEWEFLAELTRATGCGLLLDINNVYVSSRNHGFTPWDYLRAIPPDSVGEIHLAGYEAQRRAGREVLVDTHGAPVFPQVWTLFQQALRLFGPRPVLIEWDSNLPSLDVLVEEAHRADALGAASHALVA